MWKFLPLYRRAVRGRAPEVNHIDVLVNNASCVRSAPRSEIDTEAFDSTFVLNVKASFFLTGAFAPRMAANCRGAIVNVSDFFVVRSGAVVIAHGTARKTVWSASRSGAVRALVVARDAHPVAALGRAPSPARVILEVVVDAAGRLAAP